MELFKQIVTLASEGNWVEEAENKCPGQMVGGSGEGNVRLAWVSALSATTRCGNVELRQLVPSPQGRNPTRRCSLLLSEKNDGRVARNAACHSRIRKRPSPLSLVLPSSLGDTTSRQQDDVRWEPHCRALSLQYKCPATTPAPASDLTRTGVLTRASYRALIAKGSTAFNAASLIQTLNSLITDFRALRVHKGLCSFECT